MLACFKEQDELAQHRRTNKNHSLLNGARANPNYSPLGGAGHGPMADGTGKLERPAPDFESLGWRSPSEPPPSEPPKRARPRVPTTVAHEQLCVEQRISEPFDISFIFGTGVSLPTYEQLEECMRHEVAAAEAAEGGEVVAAEAAECDERATDLSKDMLDFADEQLASDAICFLQILAEFEGEFVEGGEGNKADQDCMIFNSAKVAATAAAAVRQATTKQAAAARAGAKLAPLAGATPLARGGGQMDRQVVICPQDAQLITVWIAAVSVAIFLSHAEDQGEQKMRDCAKKLDCIAKQDPRLLFFAVVCPDVEGYLNNILWGGGHQTMWCSYR